MMAIAPDRIGSNLPYHCLQEITSCGVGSRYANGGM